MMRKLITPLAISAALLFASQNIFAQNVGINTQQPDPSAALDIVGTDKGLLIPRVSLQSVTDNTTIPNPATALLVYNTNAGLGKAGFYYNAGTAASPSWSLVGGEANLSLPFAKTGNAPGAAFFIENINDGTTSSGITGNSVNAIGVRGVTQTGRGLVGATFSTGTGVFASSANTSGKALEVSGPMKIAGPGQSPGNGKVLMSDASGNASWENISGNVAFRASGILGGGSEVMPGTSIPVKIAFANENYDLGNDYNDANNSPHSTFIAPFNGIYHFDVQLTFYSTFAEDNMPLPYDHAMRLILVSNNTTSVIAQSEGLILHKLSSMLSTDVELKSGDQIHVDASVGTNIGGELRIKPEQSFFNGRLLFRE